MLRDEGGIDEGVQLPVQHAKHVPLLLPRPVVLDHLVGRQHVGPDLVAEGVVPQGGGVLVALRLPLFLLPLEDLTIIMTIPMPMPIDARADMDCAGTKSWGFDRSSTNPDVIHAIFNLRPRFVRVRANGSAGTPLIHQ